MPKITKSSQKDATNNLLIKVYAQDGESSNKVKLESRIFDQPANKKLIAHYVRYYQANQRQGNQSTKTRGEVTGSTRKIYKQKGTGRARHGDIKASIFVGGGIAHGPKPRDYSLKINKKQKRQALFQTLSLKAKENNILAISDDLTKIKPKTKLLAEFLKKIGLNDEKTLLVLAKKEKSNLILASRNLSGIEISDAMSINPFMILKNRKILITVSALDLLQKYFTKNED